MHPALLALGLALLLLLLGLLPPLWSALTAPPGGVEARGAGAPWDARVVDGGGVSVFGLRLPGSTLGDAAARWGDDLQIAVMQSRDGATGLEASVENARLGGVTGRLLLTAQVSEAELARWRASPARQEMVSADTSRLTLRPEDRAEALRAPVIAVGLIPSAQLDAEVLRHRFGEPREKVRAGETLEHWLYPDRGLSVALDAKGRELLQFVAPAAFDARLRAPLLAASAPASAPAPAPAPASAPASGAPAATPG
jgi:hypothetical protein